MATDDDASLVERVRGGDKSAFGYLIDRHRAPAMAFARRMLNAADAEDVVQDALLAAFLKLDNLREPQRFRSWLFGIVSNLSATRLRARSEVPFKDSLGGRAVAGFTWKHAEPSPEAIYETRELSRIVFRAVEVLPSDQQNAVKLHYVEGLKLSEIAILTRTPVGTVKARLHHARARLRVSLASEFALAPLSRIAGGLTMIEVNVSDVLIRSPKDKAAAWLPYEYPGLFRVILLKECAGDRVLPIWVSAGEGDVIAALLERIPFVRPSTFDVAARLLEIGKMNIEKVAVTSLRKNVFFGSIWIRAGENVQEIDARPSDAITLALKAKAAIFVTTETFEQASAFVLRAGSELSQLDTEQRKYLAEGKAEPEAREMEWRSLAHNRAGQGHG